MSHPLWSRLITVVATHSRSGRNIDPTSGAVPHEERVVQRVSNGSRFWDEETAELIMGRFP